MFVKPVVCSGALVAVLELDNGQLFVWQDEIYVCQQIVTDANDVITNVKVMKIGRYQQGTSTPKSAFVGPSVVGFPQTENFNPYAEVLILM